MVDINSHLVKIDLNKVEYALGVSYHEALSMAIRTNNELHEIIHTMQERILCLEREVRCNHQFMRMEMGNFCIYCKQKKDM